MKDQTKIKILPQHEALKIAAGEVVERPANIIKELVENSLDASATKIIIHVHQAGKDNITITDNGIGMSKQDIALATTNHATSKITSVDDLETIHTFGFRGEALCSIAAVSNVTIASKTNDTDTGYQFEWEFGTLKNQSIKAMETGTTISVAHLFENIPARKKFLKKNETEWRAIVSLFQAFNLMHPNIHFQLYQDEQLYLNCPAVHDLTTRVGQLWKNNLHSHMQQISSENNNYCNVAGVCSEINYYRYDRNQIFVFVNNRWIKNIDLTKAIMRAYLGTLPPQKFPAAALFITLPQHDIDINIHPKKEEIKFLHPKKVESAITRAIKTTLEKNHPLQQPQPITSFQNIKQYKPQQITPPQQTTSFTPLKKETFTAAPTSQKIQPQIPQPRPNNTQPHITQQKVVETKETELFNIIGQYKSTYILYEKDNNLVLIDQHAAHERIIYENLKKNFKNVATIQLMFPHIIKLQPTEIETVKAHLQLLQDHGIFADIFSDNELMITATPVHLKNQKFDDIILQIISWLQKDNKVENQQVSKELHEKIHAKMACSTAIKAGDTLSIEQMQNLLQKLKNCQNNYSCPHGRPTHSVFHIDQIEKQFKRDYGPKAEQKFDFI